MTYADRNAAIRAKLHPAHTCAVEINDQNVKAPAGRVWCVKCGQVLTRKRGESHRVFRCYTRQALAMTATGEMDIITTEQPQGCQRIIVKRPLVRAPKPKAVRDPIQKLKSKRAAAEAMLTQWDRKLALAMTKVRQYRASVKRATATVEAALTEARPVGAGKTRRIEVE